MDKQDILMIHGTDYKEMTKRLLEAANLETMIASKKAQVALKPNLVTSNPPSSGATTHPELLAGAIEYLKEHGFSNIVIMEGSWVGCGTGAAFRIAGYDRVCREYNVPFIDLQKDTSTSYDAKGMKIAVCDKAMAADFMINMPVLKGHGQTLVTCALKNNKGIIPNSEKRRFHTLGLHKPIAHLNTVAPNSFILVDNICGDLDFEEGGNPVVMNRILGALDPVLCDAYGCSLIGIPIEEVRYIAVAEACGAGSSDLSLSSVICLREEADRPQAEENLSSAGKSAATDGDLPQAEEEEAYCAQSDAAVSASLIRVRELVDEVDSCSACYANLLPAIRRLEEEGLAKYLKDRVCIGQGFRGKSGELGVGECTGYFRNNVPGCPPDTERSYRYLKEYCEKQKSLFRG